MLQPYVRLGPPAESVHGPPPRRPGSPSLPRPGPESQTVTDPAPGPGQHRPGPLGRRFLDVNSFGCRRFASVARQPLARASNTIKPLSNLCRPVFFLSIVKTIRSERAESFSLRQGVRFIIDANEGDAPVRKITNGQKPKTLLPASTEEL